VTLALAALVLAGAPTPTARPVPPTRAERGAALVDVSRQGRRWVMASAKTTVTLDARDLSLGIEAGPARWATVPSSASDMVVRTGAGGKDATVRLADAPKIDVVPYDAGFKTGVKLTLAGWPQAPGLVLHLTIALDVDDELVFAVAAEEGATVVRRLDWPTALDAREVEHTILPHYRGVLLPRTWDKPYHPIRTQRDEGKPPDTSDVQSDVVECWSMSWWGFQKGPSALLVLVETSDDAAYQFDHPAGGPTIIGPRWRAQLGRLGYPRALRMVFFAKGNYVDLAKRYRRYAQETGLWVSLKEKIARSPKVERLIGSLESRMGILSNVVPESLQYDKEDPSRNHRLTLFAERARQMRALKEKGVERFQLVLTGWHNLGYDRQHPDGLPPAPPAGGYEGMKGLADACHELGYLFTLHDQYRDYYFDAPSFDPQFAVHEEEAGGPTFLFPGTRFGAWKEGPLSVHPNWDGGRQTYLNARFMLGHMKKNYAGLFAHGVAVDGSYLDVLGYVPPDEDFNPEHPTTRTEAKREIGTLYRWARQNLGVVGTEAGSDWTVPFSDYSSPLGPGRGGIPVPLFQLVYHDAVMVPYDGPSDRAEGTGRRPGLLGAMLTGAPVRIGYRSIEQAWPQLQRLIALHRRVALLEMTNHEFLNAERTKERTTFADGTTVTVDWSTGAATVAPE
jgi:hypothetical protein